MTELVLLDLIDPNPWQPRASEDPEHIANLAASIADDGLMQIPSARLVDGRYQLTFGHSRLAAFRLLVDIQNKLEKQQPISFEDGSPLARAVTAADISLDTNGPSFGEMPLNIVELDDAGMFRAAISENLQRKDLTPIEEARAMKRAMDEFKYTSGQVGDLFGKSDATVRGKIRLLELPEAVQTKLAQGELSEGTARTLLSAKKALGEEQVTKLAGSVAEYKNPEAVLEKVRSALNENKNGIEMFNGNWNSGEPCGGSGLWPLYWTFFNMPTEQQALKTWTGPKEIESPYGGDLMMTVKIAQVFREIDLYVGRDAERWEKQIEMRPEWRDAVEHLRSLANPPVCTACPAYIKLEKVHYCGNKACWKRKKEAWISEQFDVFVAESGIPALVAGNAFLDTSDWYDRDLYKELYAKQDPHLRLKKSFNEYSKNSFTDSKFASLVDVSPERIAAKEAKQQQKNGAETDREQEAERRLHRRDASNAFILEHVYQRFVQGFSEMNNIGAMMSLTGISNERKVEGDILFADLPRDKKLDVLRAYITREALRQAIPWGLVLEGPTSVAKHLAGLGTTWGIPLPSDWLEIAQGYEPFPGESVAVAGLEQDEDVDDNDDGFYDEDEEPTEDEFETEEE